MLSAVCAVEAVKTATCSARGFVGVGTNGRNVGNQEGGKDPAETAVPSHLVGSLRRRSLSRGGRGRGGDALSSDGTRQQSQMRFA